MKKTIALLLVCMFAFALASCKEDDSGCTDSDAQTCADDYTDCYSACTDATCMEDCAADWFDCLDSQGCDEYLDEAGCE